MSSIRLRAMPVLLASAMASTTLAAQSGDMTNGIVSATFTLHGADVQLTKLQNLRENLSVDLAPAGPHFVAELEPDPSAPSWRPEHRVLVKSSDVGLGNVIYLALPPGFFKPGAPAGQLLALVFGPKVITPPPSSGQAPFIFIGAALWRLYDGAETFDASFLAAVSPLTTTTYRTWRVDFPAVDVPKLSATGGDSLLTGAYGGLLFSQPIDRINLQWPPTGLADPDFRDYQVLASDPGTYAVPVLAYMDSGTGRCVYVSTDDERGSMKQLRANAIPASNLLRLSAGLLPARDVFLTETFEVDHWIQVGLVRGDSWDVAERYRKQMAGFPWYPGPAGTATNTVVPARLKGSAVHVAQNLRSCPYGKTDTPTVLQLQSLGKQLTTLNSWFGPVPQVDWGRFAIHEWTECSNTGFTASQPVPLLPHVFFARLGGNGIVDRAFTEGLLGIWCDSNQCLTCPSPLRPPLINAMLNDNRDWLSPDGSARLFSCPAGKGTGTGIDFPAWASTTQAGAVRDLWLSGYTWTAPAFYAAPCFARGHSHAPGYGSWCSEAWIAMSRGVRAATPNGADLTVMMETSSAFFGQEVSVQNDWSFGLTPPGFADCFHPVRAKALWHGLPIRSIPLFNAVADHVKLGSVYHGDTLAMPYTGLDQRVGTQDRYFESFPAVSGAISAWSQTVRALARRGMVFIGLHEDEDLSVMDTPADDPAQRARADLVVFLRRLVAFLQGPGVKFHAGTLVRPPVVTITNDTERFMLLLAPFPRLSTYLYPLGFRGLDFAVYSPVNCSLQGVGREWFFTTTPEEKPTFLPGGMYRAVDGRLGWLVANPFGVNHLFGPVGQRVTRTLNPFTFDYATPAASPGTAYDYRVQIDPSLYAGFLKTSGQYNVEIITYKDTGTDRRLLGPLTGPLDVTDRLEPFEVRGYFLTAL